tara:strand:+ start:1977 stop:3344 length:1368 start_codon:yes stop_codon:yes gene_type:complete
MDNRELKKVVVYKNKVVSGSFLLKNKDKKNINRENYMLKNMLENKALIYNSKKQKINPSKLVSEFKSKYKKYRSDWKKQPGICIDNKLLGDELKSKNIKPLCLDIEVAAICDLACPFCFREHIVTPDKVIDEKLCYDLIDQAADLKIPSIKFNWRGEPLLNTKIYDYISYAKKKGILETIINTNATNLNEANSKKLIDSGLDLIIYSFDGGTKNTYEKMRPGRFKKNLFEEVYLNIKNFKKIKDKKNSKFPFTKIQMILAEETIYEVKNFFDLFNDYVDDVSVNNYTERGGNISNLNKEDLDLYKSLVLKHNLKKDTPYMKDIFGKISVSKGRLPCEQPYQRLLVTYEGKVAMCCYDWGASHPVGYTSKKAFNNSKDYDQVVKNVKNKKKGFKLLKNIKFSTINNKPKKAINSLEQIWFGKEIDKVRHKHCSNKSEDVSVCKNCSFKDVYKWSHK